MNVSLEQNLFYTFKCCRIKRAGRSHTFVDLSLFRLCNGGFSEVSRNKIDSVSCPLCLINTNYVLCVNRLSKYVMLNLYNHTQHQVTDDVAYCLRYKHVIHKNKLYTINDCNEIQHVLIVPQNGEEPYFSLEHPMYNVTYTYINVTPGNQHIVLYHSEQFLTCDSVDGELVYITLEYKVPDVDSVRLRRIINIGNEVYVLARFPGFLNFYDKHGACYVDISSVSTKRMICNEEGKIICYNKGAYHTLHPIIKRCMFTLSDKVDITAVMPLSVPRIKISTLVSMNIFWYNDDQPVLHYNYLCFTRSFFDNLSHRWRMAFLIRHAGQQLVFVADDHQIKHRINLKWTKVITFNDRHYVTYDEERRLLTINDGESHELQSNLCSAVVCNDVLWYSSGSIITMLTLDADGRMIDNFSLDLEKKTLKVVVNEYDNSQVLVTIFQDRPVLVRFSNSSMEYITLDVGEYDTNSCQITFIDSGVLKICDSVYVIDSDMNVCSMKIRSRVNDSNRLDFSPKKGVLRLLDRTISDFILGIEGFTFIRDYADYIISDESISFCSLLDTAEIVIFDHFK
ncbi:hypothetical protein PCE1_000189 [Barthelona sp. PCE]